MTENEINAKSLVIGRQLEREDWPSMGAHAAFEFCEKKARELGAERQFDVEAIAAGAMCFVMEGGSVGHPGQALDEAEIATDEEPNDPLVKCRICRKTWPISEMNTNGECPDCQRETAPLVKPQPESVKAGCFDV